MNNKKETTLFVIYDPFGSKSEIFQSLSKKATDYIVLDDHNFCNVFLSPAYYRKTWCDLCHTISIKLEMPVVFHTISTPDAFQNIRIPAFCNMHYISIVWNDDTFHCKMNGTIENASLINNWVKTTLINKYPTMDILDVSELTAQEAADKLNELIRGIISIEKPMFHAHYSITETWDNGYVKNATINPLDAEGFPIVQKKSNLYYSRAQAIKFDGCKCPKCILKNRQQIKIDTPVLFIVCDLAGKNSDIYRILSEKSEKYIVLDGNDFCNIYENTSYHRESWLDVCYDISSSNSGVPLVFFSSSAPIHFINLKHHFSKVHYIVIISKDEDLYKRMENSNINDQIQSSIAINNYIQKHINSLSSMSKILDISNMTAEQSANMINNLIHMELNIF